MQQYTEADIIKGLKNRDRDILKYIVEEYYPSVQYFVQHNKGREEDAEDIFQDAMVVILEKIKKGDLDLKCSLKTFIYAVSRNIWLKRLTYKRRRKLMHFSNTDDFLLEDAPSSGELDEDEKKFLFQRNILKMNDVCRKVIEFFAQQRTYQFISDHFKLGGVQAARKKKYRCMQTLIKLIKNDPEYKRMIQ